jgi:cytochrome b561
MVRISIYRLLCIDAALHHSCPCSHRCEGYEVITTDLDSGAFGEPGRTQAQAAAGTASRYSRTAIVLHWVLGVAIMGVFGVGLYMGNLPFSPLRLKLFNWHKWAGMSLLALSVLRLVWRLSHRPPAFPARIATAMPTWQHRAHGATHSALYVLFFAVPLTGWAYSSAAGFPVVVFGVLPLPDFVSPDKALAALINPWHEFSAFALMGLALLHAAAALKHQWWDRDGLVSRMWPGRS